MPTDAFTDDWRDPVVMHDADIHIGDDVLASIHRCQAWQPPWPGQGRVSAEHREGSLETPRVLPDNIGGPTRAHSPRVSRVDADGRCSEPHGVRCFVATQSMS